MTVGIQRLGRSRVPAQRRVGLERAQRDLRGANVLVVGINYWPEPTGIAPYTTALAEHLVGAGAGVEVLTGLPCYPTWEVPPPYRRGLRFTESRNGVRITRLAHLVPRRQDALRRGAYEVSFLAQLSTIRPGRRPDVVLGVTPALAGAVGAVRLAERFRSRSVLLVQDLMGLAAAQSGMAGGSREAGAVSQVESWALRRADAVAMVSDGFRAPLALRGVPADRMHTIGNWARAAAPNGDRELTRVALGWGPDQVIALHTGNMGLKQDLGNLLAAARHTRHRRDLRWVLMGEGSQRADLVRAARDLSNLQFLPLCPQEQYADVLAAADVLLLNERPGVGEMCLPSKLTGYFTSSRVVVGAVGTDGATARELARAGAVEPVAPGQPVALAEAVLALADDPDRREAHGRAGAEYAAAHLTFAAAMRRFEELL